MTPRVMIDALMHITPHNMNMFSAKCGVSSMFSPNVLMNKPPIDCDEHLKCMFGKCGQAHLDRVKMNNVKE